MCTALTLVFLARLIHREVPFGEVFLVLISLALHFFRKSLTQEIQIGHSPFIFVHLGLQVPELLLG